MEQLIKIIYKRYCINKKYIIKIIVNIYVLKYNYVMLKILYIQNYLINKMMYMK